MTSRLDGARGKVQRSKELLGDLLVKYRDFMNLNPFGVVVERNPDTAERIWRARVSRPVPETWSFLVGDIVHNLRAALDYLAWELWIANGGDVNDQTASRIWFPVKDPAKTSSAKEEHAESKRWDRLFGTVPARLIDRLQTDEGRKPPADPALRPLLLLHKLDIWDKHRRLNIVGGTVRLAEMKLGGPGENVHIAEMVLGGGNVRTVPIADGTELMRLTLDPSTPDVHLEQQFTHFVAFEQEGPANGEPVIETLDRLITFVDEALTRFGPLLPAEDGPLGV